MKLNHFARVCRSARQSQGRREAQVRDNANIRPLNTSDNNSQSGGSDSCCYAVNNENNRNPVTKLKINNRNIKFTVDTGSINVMDHQTFTKLGNIKLATTNIKAVICFGQLGIEQNIRGLIDI